MEKSKIILDYLKGNFPGHTHKNNPYNVLVSCVLSQRARDEMTAKVSYKLLKKAPTPKKLASMKLEDIERIIKPIGFYRTKARRLKEIGKIISNKKIPETREGLMELPGVGRKTANVVLCYGFGKPAMAIDTHCNRIPKRIGLINEKAKLIEVEEKLKKLFPKKDWCVINIGFVTFGKNICKPIGPLCDKCPFNSFCKFYKEVTQQ